MKNKLGILILLVGFCRQAEAQLATIPFQLAGKNVVIPVRINDSEPFDLVYDTGTVGSVSLDSTIAEQIGISQENRQQATITGHGSAHQYALVPHQEIRLSGVTLQSNLSLINFNAFSSGTGFRLKGLIGDAIMQHYVTQVDFDDHQMKLYQTIDEVDTAGYTGIPFTYDRGVAIPRFPITLTLNNGERVTGKVMFDSGNGTTLLVSTPFSLYHDLDHKLGTTTVANGMGIDAVTTNRQGLIRSMTFNGFDFGQMTIELTVNPKAVPADGYLGILGFDIISRFNLILDYAHSKIYLKPNAAYRHRFELDAFNRKIAPQLEGQQFLSNNQKRPGVRTTTSGLEYEVLREGEGPRPQANAKVTLYFSASLLNGKTVLGPFNKDKPFTHRLDKVLEGMREALRLMPVGSKYKLYIPANLAFGEVTYDDIPGGSVIVCELELVKIEN